MRGYPGVTLIELVVVLAILATLATVAAPAALPRIRSNDSVTTEVARLRAAALEGRAARTATVVVNSRTLRVTALPDGRVLADTALHIDRLSGLPDAKTQ